MLWWGWVGGNSTDSEVSSGNRKCIFGNNDILGNDDWNSGKIDRVSNSPDNDVWNTIIEHLKALRPPKSGLVSIAVRYLCSRTLNTSSNAVINSNNLKRLLSSAHDGRNCLLPCSCPHSNHLNTRRRSRTDFVGTVIYGTESECDIGDLVGRAHALKTSDESICCLFFAAKLPLGRRMFAMIYGRWAGVQSS